MLYKRLDEEELDRLIVSMEKSSEKNKDLQEQQSTSRLTASALSSSSYGPYREVDVESVNSKKTGSQYQDENEEYSDNESPDKQKACRSQDVVDYEEEEEENDVEDFEETHFENLATNTNHSDDENSSSEPSPQISTLISNAPTLIADSEPYNSSQYSRLTRTVRSYLNASNSIQIASSEQTNESILSRFDSNINLTLNSMNSQNDKFQAKSFQFERVLDSANKLKFQSKSSKVNIDLNAFVNLANLFLKHENYYTTMLTPMSDNFNLIDSKSSFATSKRMKHSLPEESNPLINFRNYTPNDEDDEQTDESQEINFNLLQETTSSSNSSNSSLCNLNTENSSRKHKLPANEFHLCALCSHCLFEPVTLVCGCSFCKNCLTEYNSGLSFLKGSNTNTNNNNNTNLNKTDSHLDAESVESSNEGSNHKRKLNNNPGSLGELGVSSNKCYNCACVHDQNTTEYCKQNVLVCKLVDKYWFNNVEIRKLRNDIRRYVCFAMENDVEKFNFKKFSYMLEKAYELDPSNNLLLADLFILNYFHDCTENCLKYAQMACDLRPNWPFAYYMKSIYNQKIGDLNEMKNNLMLCLKLEPNLEPVRMKLSQLICKLNRVDTSCKFLNESNDSYQNSHLYDSQNNYSNTSTDVFSCNDSKNQNSTIKENISKENNRSKKPTQSVLNFETSKYVVINSHLVKPVELECSLCYRLLYKPVTTPCGHSFCCSCLDRSLDHQDKCPLCKHTLADYLAERRQNVTIFIDKLIKNFYPNEYEERKNQLQDELRELMGDENEIPVFVCTLGMPFVPCPLHIYEPRYRLMLRRAIEAGSKQFGMCMYSETTSYRYTEYGCMLEIKSCQFTRDGRAIVATMGGRRFKVLRSTTKDGYNVAKIEWVTDVKVENEQEKIALQQLHDEVYRLASTWYSFIPETQKNRIYSIYGISELPEPESDIQSDNGPMWHWILLNILPLDSDLQYKFLTKTKLRERLIQMRKIILVLMAPLRHMFYNTTSSNQANNNQTNEPNQSEHNREPSLINSDAGTTASNSDQTNEPSNDHSSRDL